MSLPAMSADIKEGTKIPGEIRIPLAALEIAPDFWGWPALYNEPEINPRKRETGGERRTYRNRRAIWRTSSVEHPDVHVAAEVRMYMYSNSSDFRMMVGELNRLGAKSKDIVRITRSEQGDRAYDCVLARAPGSEPRTDDRFFEEWSKLLVNKVHQSYRAYGYA